MCLRVCASTRVCVCVCVSMCMCVCVSIYVCVFHAQKVKASLCLCAPVCACMCDLCYSQNWVDLIRLGSGKARAIVTESFYNKH